ncbi:MAG: type IV pilus modification PilV family protein [Nitrospirota bacterium]
MSRLFRASERAGKERRSSRPGPAQGFTLLEILVAIAVLSIAVTIVLQLFSANLRTIAVSGDYVTAATMAQVKMREVLDEENPVEQALSEVTDNGYRIDTSITETLQERTENLQVKMLELVVSVHWVKGIKERSLTIRTLKAVEKEI